MAAGYRYAALDGIRGIAAQVVLVGHLLNFMIPGMPDLLAVWVSWSARLAVMVFFVLSGFVITVSLRKLIAEHPRHYALHYAVHRVARILPPLVLAVSLAFAVAAIGRSGWVSLLDLRNAQLDMGVLAFLRGITLTFLQTDATWGVNGPLWSLRHEVYLYGVIALAGVAFMRRDLFGAVAGLIAVGLVVVTSGRFFYIQSLALFGCGSLAAIFGTAPLARRASASWIPPVLLAAMVLAPVLVLEWGAPFLTALSNDPWFLAWQGLVALPLSLTLLGLASRETAASAAFARLKRTGGYSYTLYVTHNPVLVLFYSVLAKYQLAGGWASSLAWGLLALALCQVLALGAAAVLERPGDYRRLLWRLLGAAGVPGAVPAVDAGPASGQNRPPAVPAADPVRKR